MKKYTITAILWGMMVFLGGCTQHMMLAPEGGQVSDTQVQLDEGEVTGGVNADGQYTGSDGLSRSGFHLLYFGYNSYRLDDKQMQRVVSDLPRIRQLAARGTIRIEGNCDEFGTDQFNYALGLKRAKAVKALLVTHGIPAAKIAVVSYGESNPVCRGHQAACHAKNRRAEINGVR